MISLIIYLRWQNTPCHEIKTDIQFYEWCYTLLLSVPQKASIAWYDRWAIVSSLQVPASIYRHRFLRLMLLTPDQPNEQHPSSPICVEINLPAFTGEDKTLFLTMGSVTKGPAWRRELTLLLLCRSIAWRWKFQRKREQRARDHGLQGRQDGRGGGGWTHTPTYHEHASCPRFAHLEMFLPFLCRGLIYFCGSEHPSPKPVLFVQEHKPSTAYSSAGCGVMGRSSVDEWATNMSREANAFRLGHQLTTRGCLNVTTC